ncbi:MAG: hypothetical protein AMXMBFR83_00110 [Phycisphaerae bacterium]
MLILRIHRATTALADGRLDEAFGLAQAADFQAHRKGQKVIGRLARALIERGREHLSAGRLADAKQDCDKVAALAGNLPELAELRTQIEQEVAARRKAERHRGDVLVAAREQVDNGRLSIAGQWLEKCDQPSTRIDVLRDQVAARRIQAEEALRRARQARAREDWPAAAAALIDARRAHPGDAGCAEVSAELARTLTQRAGAAIDQGRLDLADSLLEPAEQIHAEALEVRELSRFLDQCREAFSCVEQGRPREATEILRRLLVVRPAATWLGKASSATQQAAEQIEALRSGPLGWLDHDPEATWGPPARNGDRPGREHPSRDRHGAEAVILQPAKGPHPRGAEPLERGPNRAAPAGPLPSRLLFHVDGVGSYLVLRDRLVTLGPVSSSRHPEVALLAEPGLPVAAIERTDEDYFLSCDAGVQVNDAPATRKLLANGDRIALSARTRIRFSLPHAASTTAVLHLAGTRLPASDARQVILLDRELVMGPGPAAHIRADVLPVPAVLLVHDGRLLCKTSELVLVNDRPLDRNAGIPLGARVQVGAVSFVVRAA